MKSFNSWVKKNEQDADRQNKRKQLSGLFCGFKTSLCICEINQKRFIQNKTLLNPFFSIALLP